jgi:peptidoglycan/LPS O-acetylase OafA/YrhL
VSNGKNDMPLAIRGAACLVVVVAHSWQVFLNPVGVPDYGFGPAAAWSVATFFLLSGLLIAWSIKRRTGAEGFHLGGYLQARVLRIYPPLVAAVVVTGLVALTINSLHLYGSDGYLLPGDVASARARADWSWKQVPTTLALTFNLIPGHNILALNGPLWSLSFEWWLYIMAGLAVAVAANRSMAALGLLVLLICTIVFISHAAWLAICAVWWLGFATGWWWPHVQRLPALAIAGIGVAGAVIAATISGGDPSYLQPTYRHCRKRCSTSPSA